VLSSPAVLKYNTKFCHYQNLVPVLGKIGDYSENELPKLITAAI
jgi:hypothetical protein